MSLFFFLEVLPLYLLFLFKGADLSEGHVSVLLFEGVAGVIHVESEGVFVDCIDIPALDIYLHFDFTPFGKGVCLGEETLFDSFPFD